MATVLENSPSDAPPLGGNDQQILRWANSIVDDGEDRRQAWEGIWWENIATYLGDLWAEWDPHKNRLFETTPPADHRVRLAVNLGQPIVRTEYAKLLKNRPISDVVARSDDPVDLDAAKVADDILNTYVEREFMMPRVRRRTIQWATICGGGGLFVDHDKTKGPVIPSSTMGSLVDEFKSQITGNQVSEKTDGELRIVPFSPFQLLYDFSKLDIYESSWCIIQETYTQAEVLRRWHKDVDGQDNATPGVIETRMLNKLDVTGTLMFRKPKTGNLVKVNRLYVLPGHPYFPDGLHLAFTKNEVLEAEAFPFDHGRLPIAYMGHIPLPTAQYGMSVLQSIRQPIMEISRTVSQLIENRNLMANPPWLIPKQSRLEGDIENKPGMQLVYNHSPIAPAPSPVQMPEMPAYVRELVDSMRQIVLEMSGQGETSQGRVPAGARSGVAIAYLQEEDDTKLGPTVQEYEELIEVAGNLILATIAEKYGVERTVRVYRPHSDPQVTKFIGRTIAGCEVIVQAGSALPRSKAAKQQYILDLWDRKIEQDPRRVRMMLELSDGEPEDWELDMRQADRENDLIIAGKGEEVMIYMWQNHAAHRSRHERFMKSADFEKLRQTDPQKYTQLLQHNQQHIMYEQQMAANMQAAGGGGEGGDQPAPGENGQTRPEGPQAPFSGGSSPRDMLSDQPQ